MTNSSTSDDVQKIVDDVKAKYGDGYTTIWNRLQDELPKDCVVTLIGDYDQVFW